MSNRTYDILKFVALVVMPAVATLYAALSGIWGFPRGQEVIATITAVDLAIGALLKWASDRYDKDGDGEYDQQVAGTFRVNTTEDGSAYRLLLDLDPEELEQMKSFRLNVVRD